MTNYFKNNNKEPQLMLPSPGKVTSKVLFKTAFKIIAYGIVVQQIFYIGLWGAYDFSFEITDERFDLISEIFGIVWYLFITYIIILDIKEKNIRPLDLFNFKLSKIQESKNKIIKYFLSCAVFIFITSLFSSETELGMESKSVIMIVLFFVTAVIMAPICEEIAFRGYLLTGMRETFHRKKERLVVNAMLFAAAHVLIILFFIGASVPFYIFILGYLLAKLYEEHNSIMPCILLHLLNNLFVFVIDYLKAHDMYVNILS